MFERSDQRDVGGLTGGRRAVQPAVTGLHLRLRLRVIFNSAKDFWVFGFAYHSAPSGRFVWSCAILQVVSEPRFSI